MGSTKIATVSNNEVRFHFQDHLGSANVVTNSSGAVVELIEYKPFGGFARRDQFGTSNAAWYYFTGKPLDEETGLMFYGARYYSPKLGKFITPDTIVQSPGNPQTLNRYTYCNNNPVNLVDPTGHSWKKFWKAAVAAIVSAVVFVATGGTATPVIAGFWAGMAGGAVSGALSGGGWKGVLQGAAFGALTGAVLGGVGAWGIDKFGNGFGWGMLAAGGAYAAATGNLDSFAGGLAGGMLGGMVANAAFNGSSASTSESRVDKLLEQLESDPDFHFGEAILQMNASSDVITIATYASVVREGANRADSWWGRTFDPDGSARYQFKTAYDSWSQDYKVEIFMYKALLVAGTVKQGGALLLGESSPVFGWNGAFNSGRYIRAGWGRKGGEKVFRIAGEWVQKMFGREKIDLWNGGQL